MFIYGFYSTVWGKSAGVPHTHQNHEFFFSIDGNCRQVAGEKILAMAPETLCLFPMGVPHNASRYDGEAPCTCWVINVDDEYLAGHQDGDAAARQILEIFCRRAYAGENLLPLGKESRQAARAAFMKITEEFRQRRPGWAAAVKAAFMTLLFEVYRGWPEGHPLEVLPDSGKQGRMRDVLAYIDNNYMKPLMVDDLLPLAHLSRSRFHAVFAAEAGCPFKTYLNRVRIAQAERSLAETALPVTDIALGCGFNSLSQFYAAFKEIRGNSPCRWRRDSGGKTPPA